MEQAQDMNELLLEQVQKLPPLPKTVRDLKLYVEQEGSHLQINKVAEIIQGDPIVTAKLLQLANSPFYSFSRQITTIQQAVNLLGAVNVKNMIVADSLKGEKADVSAYGLNTDKFLSNCSAEVQFVSDWLSHEDKQLSYFLIPCAMLLRFGMIIFSNFLIENKKDKDFLRALKEHNFQNIDMVENDFLGVDHISFLGFLFYRWGFDESLIETICFINTPHAAENKIKKSAYALAITNHIFSPYDGGSVFKINVALNLIKEAKTQGVDFNIDNFTSKLPDFARNNLKQALEI
ncbi:HDOD domain-containing protein [Campylobacter sp. MIT 99-7217]|uniref:HDOD domain-containing protein n=1 Tax=Campylobacter sp. MIT 99-7217 TaxID=535091 RepID=UPI001159523B|nr:HDOD domain-containing protein [Campylobacter sp. MIT 99-7217]TQR32425.1 HDOD domain-containing protein [Campylobacter sp. MIT 99-7217]